MGFNLGFKGLKMLFIIELEKSDFPKICTYMRNHTEMNTVVILLGKVGYQKGVD